MKLFESDIERYLESIVLKMVFFDASETKCKREIAEMIEVSDVLEDWYIDLKQTEHFFSSFI